MESEKTVWEKLIGAEHKEKEKVLQTADSQVTHFWWGEIHWKVWEKTCSSLAMFDIQLRKSNVIGRILPGNDAQRVFPAPTNIPLVSSFHWTHAR